MTASILLNGSATALAVLTGTPVALTNQSNVGVQGWTWTLVDRPDGSAATITDPTLAVASITPDVTGTYLIQLQTWTDVAKTILDDQDRAATYILYTVAPLWRIPAVYETDEVGTDVDGWADGTIGVNQIIKDIHAFIAGGGGGGGTPNYAILGSAATPTWADVQTAHATFVATLANVGDAEFTIYLSYTPSVAAGTYDWECPIKFVGVNNDVTGTPRTVFTVSGAVGAPVWFGPAFTFENIDFVSDGANTFPVIGADGSNLLISIELDNSSASGASVGGAFGPDTTSIWQFTLKNGSWLGDQALSNNDASPAGGGINIYLYDGCYIANAAPFTIATVPTIYWMGDTYPNGLDGSGSAWASAPVCVRAGSGKYKTQIICNAPFNVSTLLGTPGDYAGSIYIPAGFVVTGGYAWLATNNGGGTNRAFVEIDGASGVIAAFESTPPTTGLAVCTLMNAPFTPPVSVAFFDVRVFCETPGDTAQLGGIVLWGTPSDSGAFPA